MAIVLTDDKHYKAIANVMRNYTAYGAPSTHRPDTMATNLSIIFDDRDGAMKKEGKQEAYDDLWDAQYNPNSGGYIAFFAGASWNDNTFKPKTNIVLRGNCNFLCYSNKVSDLVARLKEHGVTFDTTDVVQIQSGFSYFGGKTVPFLNLQKCSSLTYLFQGSSSIVEIEGMAISESCTFSSTFSGCTNLEKLTIEGVIGQNGFNVSDSTKLTHDSLMSIINALKDFSGMSHQVTYFV